MKNKSKIKLVSDKEIKGILKDRQLVKDLKQGLKDAEQGRYRRIKSVPCSQ